jgi:NitT/TauT family transport system substrate-binding protein
MYTYGIKSGIYEREGIDLRVLEGTGSGPVIQSIGAGTDNFGEADVNTAAIMIARGVPVKVLGAFVQTTPSSVIFFADSGIKAPKDLEGRKVAQTAGDANDQLFKPFLIANKVDEGKVQKVYLDPQSRPTALMTNQVDAMGGYYTHDAALVEQNAKRKVAYLRVADFGVNLLSRGIVVNTKNLANRDLTCRMMRATVTAWSESAKNPDRAIQALLEMFPKAGSFEFNKLALVNMLALKDTKYSRGKTWGWIADEDWNELLNFQRMYAGVTNLRAPQDYYTNEFIECR